MEEYDWGGMGQLSWPLSEAKRADREAKPNRLARVEPG